MTLTVSNTTFPAGQTTQITVTITGGENTHAYFGSNDSKIRVSLDGTTWSEDVRLYVGETTVYVKVQNSVPSGVMQDGLGWFMTDYEESVTDSVDITITGGAVQNYESISFGFGPRASTVQYNANMVQTPVALRNNFTGNVLDHAFTFEIERVQEQGQRRLVSGSAHAEKLVNSLITYTVEYEFDIAWLGWRRPSFQDHINAIASVIGKTIVFRGANFYPKTDMNIMLRKSVVRLYEQLSGSFGEILNRLIGWSDTCPSMVYNLYVDNGVIYIIQRGYEQNTRTPENWAVMPTITHTVRRTQWGDSQYQTLIPKEITSSDAANSNTPFSGTLTWGTTTLVYEDGYLITETRGNSTTTYTYTSEAEGKYLSQKETTDTDNNSYSKTTYTYQSTGEQKYLHEEHLFVYDGTDDTGVLETDQITRHVPIGNGWYGTTVIDNINNEEVSTSLSQGMPGQKASQYLIDSANDALKPANSQRQMTVPLTGVAKARQSYPVADYDTLEDIADCLNLYEGKEEVTLNGEIVGGNHIYNFDDKIVYNGNTYFLVSNNVSRTYNSVRQSITAVRWILS